MLTTLSRRSASANRRASNRSVFAAYPAFSFVLRGSTTHTRAPVAPSASTKAHVGPVASTAIAECGPTPRATNRAMPSAVRGHRASQRRSPVSVIAHTWKNALCRYADILSVHGLSSSLSPEHAWLSDRIISGAATGRRPFHLNQRTGSSSGGGSPACGRRMDRGTLGFTSGAGLEQRL